MDRATENSPHFVLNKTNVVLTTGLLFFFFFFPSKLKLFSFEFNEVLLAEASLAW